MKIACKNIVMFFLLLANYHNIYAQAPASDDCANAETIVIANNGFGLGNFTSTQVNITNATIQTGENFAPAIFVAGLDDKSVWFKFSLPTIRAVRVTLSQPGTTIAAGDVGFAVYKDNNCLPTNDSISTKLTPIVTWGNTYHPCVPAGDYLVQVSSNMNANGPITITVEISDQTGAAYDHPVDAYAFGVANVYNRKIDFDAECQSIEDATEVCTALNNYTEYHKSAWFTFTTPAYLDYLVVTLSSDGAATYFPSGGQNILKKFGYSLYRGNAVASPISSLTLVDGCDSMVSNGYYAAKQTYRCDELQPNTTYSIQLFIHKDFSDPVRVGIMTGGVSPTAGPLPVNTLPASNDLGILPSSGAGIATTASDYFGCNSRHSTTPCNPSKPATGVTVRGNYYNLSSFVKFSLARQAAINFMPAMAISGPRPVIRLFKQTLTANCTGLDTANIIGTADYNDEIECLSPGDYVMQVLGVDTPYYTLNDITCFASASNHDNALFSNLGGQYNVTMTVYNRQATSNFSLSAPGKFDSINAVGGTQFPLSDGVTYQSLRDTIGCESTLRPWDTTCSPLNDKIIYRQFIVADSGTVTFDDMIYDNNPPFRYRLYAGDANALATAQNVFGFPDRVTGIVPNSLCMDGNEYCQNKSACVLPGTYTFASMASTGAVGVVDQPSFTFKKTRTRYNSLANALDMGSILDTLGPNGGTINAKRDYWECSDNAIPINGYSPCDIGGRPATKAIYRQFYLKEDAIIQFLCPEFGGWCVGQAHGTKTLFYGKATDGMAGLTPVGNQWNCFYNASTSNNCSPLRAGWYTFVSWGTGPSYDSTTRLAGLSGRHNSYVSYFDEVDIIVTPACPGPKFNRPYKASVATGNTPHLIQWGTTSISTPVYPRTDTTFTLPAEYFNCTVDTPFSSHPIVACEASSNRVAYYVFRTTQVSFLQINTGGDFAAVYDKDVRTDSLLFGAAAPIHPCNASIGNIQFCHFQPGTYTLVIFAEDANMCRSVSPSIFIDRVGYSRFDFAGNAYDFGTVPPDSVFHFGKAGDINPLHPTRPPSSDFIYCTTGAFGTDPINTACNVTVNGNIYSAANNQPLFDSNFPQTSGDIARRNLWYTFVIDYPGTVKIKVENKTLNRALQPRFAVYSSDVDASLPFSAVQAGRLVDSTVTDGLRFVTMNYIDYWYCYHAPNNISFYRDPCTATPTRYYILVDNVNGIQWEPGGQLPNTQLDVSIQFDSFNMVAPKFDHYYQANNIGPIGAGAYSGEQDNYSCATRDATDPLGNGQNGCSKTLWYKFTSTITGNVRYRIRIGNNVAYDYDDIQLFKEIIPGDSTATGLQWQAKANVNSPTGPWGQTCVTTGTYYLLLPGCRRVNEYVTPEIELIEQEGDFCSRAVPAAINGTGSASASVLVNCHTIGTDYGEFGPALTCPQDGVTAQYKTSWFRMDIGGTDTLDVTTFLVENTNASSSDIKYRMMTGDCGAMQEQSCVLDALTQNTYECLVPGQSYYIQVFTPILKNGLPVTGTIDLQLSAVSHADTCMPLNNCLATANFLPLFDCTKDETIKFVNYSTFGSNIAYQWSFGHNGATSTDVSPSYFYPALSVDSTYTIKLVVRNTSCGKVDSSIRAFTAPARPFIDFGPDIIQCNSTAPVVLRATSHPGATYLWQNNSIADTFRVATTGDNDYRVSVTYNGCISTDTVRVLISPLAPRPLKQVVLCSDSVLIDVRRGGNETYLWNTGATTRSIYMSMQGYYWVDISYSDCTYRDSFLVVTPLNAKPLGNDTTLCFSQNSYILNAAMAGAVSYTWQNTSTADTFAVNASGEYHVAIDFGGCIIRDTINILGYPAPVVKILDTSICYGEAYFLPWNAKATVAGTYRDTLRSEGGCDSVIRSVNLTVKPRPNAGRDTTICSGLSSYIIDATTTGAVAYTWQDGSTGPVYNVTAPGLYIVHVNFGGCNAADSVSINLLAKAQTLSVDTGICAGSSLMLPWGLVVNDIGTYTDTLRAAGGCDSLIRVYNVINATKPYLGNDIAITTCSNVSVDLTSYFSITGLTSKWLFNNNPVTNPASINIQGDYTLIVTNATGCNDTALVMVSVSNKPALGNDTAISVCRGQIINLNTFYNTAGLIFNWTLNGAAVNDPSLADIAGTYTLIASNIAGCSDTAYAVVNINPKPIIGNDTVINICTGYMLNLNTIYNLSGGINTWTINGILVSNPSVVSVPGVYQLINTVASGCADTVIVTVATVPAPVVVTIDPAGICEPLTADLTTADVTTGSSPGLNYTYWTNAAATDAYNKPATTNAGTYFIKGTDQYGCIDIKPVTVISYPRPLVDAGKDALVCDNGTAVLSATVSGNLVPVTYEWIPVSVGGITDPFAPSTLVKPAATQQYIVSVNDNSHGCNFIVRDTVIITVRPPVPAFAGNDTIAIFGQPHQLKATGGIYYTWSPSSLLNDPSLANPVAMLIHDSTRLTVIVKDAVGCIGYDTIWIRAFNNITYYVPNAFSPNNDGKNEIFRPIPIGIIATEMFSIYNRYGEQVFYTNQFMKGWDGTYKSRPQPIGNYIWVLRGKGANGRMIEMKGNVVLIR